MTKTKAAFLHTCDNLFRKHGKVYFWTLTFYKLHDDWECSRRFSRFLQHLRKVIGGGWGGVRVCELHKEHGVHYHMLITQRIPADLVRNVGRCYGIGRVHACVADADTAMYMGKYLSKQKHGPKTVSGRNARRWAAFGDVDRTRVSDLVNDSPMWVYRREHNMPYLGFWQEKIITRAWDHGPQAMAATWAALKDERGRTQDACAVALGLLHAKGTVTICQSLSQDLAELERVTPF